VVAVGYLGGDQWSVLVLAGYALDWSGWLDPP
jgi:hypothetical protein